MRVNPEAQKEKIKELTDKYLTQSKTSLEIAQQEYTNKYKEFAKEYCNKKGKEFALQTLTLYPYDADNQSFLIATEKWGDILLPVPVDQAPNFKQNWDIIKYQCMAEFVPCGNDVALKSVSFGDYTYDSNTQTQYAKLDIDYNFAPINIDDLNIDLDFKSSEESIGPKLTSGQPKKIAPTINTLKVGDLADVDIDIPKASIKSQNTFAIIIANCNYQYASTVANANNDGNIVEKYFLDSFGIPEQNVSVYHDATYGQIATAINRLKDIADAYKEDNFNILFYYVGHGLPDDKTKDSYILPVDIDPRNIELCYPTKELYNTLGSLGAERVTVFMDACFSGANHGEGQLISKSMGVRLKAKSETPIGNMVVLTAAQGDETAFPYEEKRHGLFTYWLLKGVQQSKANISLGELSKFVTDNVKKTSVVVNNKLQTPSTSVSPNLSETWSTLPLIR